MPPHGSEHPVNELDPLRDEGLAYYRKLENVDLPGRLGDPDCTLATDPRADVRLVAAMAPLGLAGRADPVPLDADSSLEDIRALAAQGEPGFEHVFDALFASLPPVEGVESRTEVITGADGNEISLYIHRPAGSGRGVGVQPHRQRHLPRRRPAACRGHARGLRRLSPRPGLLRPGGLATGPSSRHRQRFAPYGGCWAASSPPG